MPALAVDLVILTSVLLARASQSSTTIHRRTSRRCCTVLHGDTPLLHGAARRDSLPHGAARRYLAAQCWATSGGQQGAGCG
jgi:hypothetical protein